MRKGSNDHGIINVLYAAMHMMHFLKSHSVSIENHFGLKCIKPEKRYHRTGISKCFENVNINNSFFYFQTIVLLNRGGGLTSIIKVPP